MSKAFTKEDAPDAPVLLPARSPLPPDAPNYVTPRGLTLLRTEAAQLGAERNRIEATMMGDERTHALARIAHRKAELDQHLASASVVGAAAQPPDEVRFGATVSLRAERQTGGEVHRIYQIVGVDEADAKMGLIAFVSPLARALLGRGVGETVSVPAAPGAEEWEIVGITYL